MKDLNIVICGVGGQGTLLASRILGHIAMELGHDVKVSEVHGMSQRGGSVITYVRMGEKVYSPMIEQKGADFVLAFEELEALRDLTYLKDGGTRSTRCCSARWPSAWILTSNSGWMRSEPAFRINSSRPILPRSSRAIMPDDSGARQKD